MRPPVVLALLLPSPAAVRLLAGAGRDIAGLASGTGLAIG
jgi:hypothetical protein